MEAPLASPVGGDPLQQADDLAERMVRVPLDLVQEGQLLPQAGLDARFGYSPRSSLGANGLSEAPPEASGCSAKNALAFSMKLFHSAGTLSPG